MGYTTEFSGKFSIEPALDANQTAYLKRFSETRRMRRDPALLTEIADPLRQNVGLPVGRQGAYFVGSADRFGQDFNHPSVTSVQGGNTPPEGQPGLWCQWEPTEDGCSLQWNEAEKFYNYVEWLQYLIEHFLKPWGRTVNGRVTWQGEEDDDTGVIVVTSNVVKTRDVGAEISRSPERSAGPVLNSVTRRSEPPKRRLSEIRLGDRIDTTTGMRSVVGLVREPSGAITVTVEDPAAGPPFFRSVLTYPTDIEVTVESDRSSEKFVNTGYEYTTREYAYDIRGTIYDTPWYDEMMGRNWVCVHRDITSSGVHEVWRRARRT